MTWLHPRTPHQARGAAESFGADAEGYDRARPSYPQALIERLVTTGTGGKVLDVGCGTGIAARQLQAAGCHVLGIEPDERMAEVARASGLDVEVATFEDWDPADRKFDLVVAAQAWHWVDPVAGAAKAAQVLHPGGSLAVFWNAFEPPPELTQAFAAVYRRVQTGLPFNPWVQPALEGYLALCAKAVDTMRRSGDFAEPEQWRFDWDRSYTRQEWLELVPTIAGHSQIPPTKLDELLSGIGAAIEAAGGTFPMHYVTVAVTAVRTTA